MQRNGRLGGATNLVVREPTVTVSGKATDDRGIVDTFVFVGGRKVYYASNKKAADPQRQAFAAQLPLKPGANVVTVVSRHSQETTTRRAFVIRRDGPNGELLATQKHSDELDGLDDGGAP